MVIDRNCMCFLTMPQLYTPNQVLVTSRPLRGLLVVPKMTSKLQSEGGGVRIVGKVCDAASGCEVICGAP